MMNNIYFDDFPILSSKDDKGNRLVYLDNASTTQKPKSVIKSVSDYYNNINANIHRGAYKLSVESTIIYDNAKNAVKSFINAKSADEIIFTKGATEALNLVAYTYGEANIKENDEIVISILEHHSNLIPWQQLAIRKKARLVYMYCDSDGVISDDEIAKITKKTKIVSITGMSNVLGTIPPVKKIIDKAHAVGAVVVVDAAQAVAHKKTDVQDLDADFLAFSGHKMLSPMGIGVLYAKQNILKAMPPFLYGGDMVEYVKEQSTTFAPYPQLYEGGTQNIAAAYGLSKAIEYLNNIGMDKIAKIEKELTAYALEKMQKNNDVIIYGSKNKENRAGVISFSIKDVHPHDIASILDAEDNVAVRSGHHCAQPLMKHLGINSTCRASFYFYNTKEDVDVFANSLKKVRPRLGFK